MLFYDYIFLFMLLPLCGISSPTLFCLGDTNLTPQKYKCYTSVIALTCSIYIHSIYIYIHSATLYLGGRYCVLFFVCIMMKKKEIRKNCYSSLIPSVCTSCFQFKDTELCNDTELFTTWFQSVQVHFQAFCPV